MQIGILIAIVLIITLAAVLFCSGKIQFLLAAPVVVIGAIAGKMVTEDFGVFGGNKYFKSTSDICMVSNVTDKMLLEEAKRGYKQESLVLKMLNCAINDKTGTSQDTLRPIDNYEAAEMDSLNWLKVDFQKGNKWLSKHLSLDGYGEFGYNNLVKIALEYQGVLHYEIKTQSVENYINSRYNDRKKRELCAANGVQLIVIPYTKFGDMNYLLSRLKDALMAAAELMPNQTDAEKFALGWISKSYPMTAPAFKYAEVDEPPIDGEELINAIDYISLYYKSTGGKPQLVQKLMFNRNISYGRYLRAVDIYHEHLDRGERISLDDAIMAADVNTAPSYGKMEKTYVDVKKHFKRDL